MSKNRVIFTANDSHFIDLQEAKGSFFEGIRRIAESSYSPDLMFIHFILLHEGGNDNGDYFLRDEIEQLWPSFVGKPITWEHDQPYIGHITDSRLVKPSEDAPDPRWYIECAGIIWRARYSELATLIADGVKTGSRKMSMEVYFSDYLFMLGDNQDKLYTEEDAPYLSKLKGRTYQGEKVWRVLLGTHGGGAGVVEMPADQDALILNVAKREVEENIGKSQDIYVDYEQCVAHLTVSDIESLVPSEGGDDSENKEVKSGMEEFEKLQEAIANLENKIDALSQEDDKELESVKAELENTKSELEATKANLEAKVRQLEADLEKVRTEYDNYKAQVEHEKAEAAKDKLASDRIAELKESGIVVNEAKADKWFKRLREMDDEAYADFKDMLLDNVSNEDGDGADEGDKQSKGGAETGNDGDDDEGKEKEEGLQSIIASRRSRYSGPNLEDKQTASLFDKATKFWSLSLEGKNFYKEDE